MRCRPKSGEHGQSERAEYEVEGYGDDGIAAAERDGKHGEHECLQGEGNRPQRNAYRGRDGEQGDAESAASDTKCRHAI